MTERKVLLKPPPTVISASVIAVTAGILLAVWALRRTHELTVFGVVLMALAVPLFLLLGLDGIQRRYVIEKAVVRKRILFRWRKYRLPCDVEMHTSPAGQVLLESKTDARVIVRIPREHNRRDVLSTELEAFFAEARANGVRKGHTS